MRKILLLGLAREGSTRVKNKMTRNLYKGKSLFSIYLKKFELLQDYTPFRGVAMAVYPGDKILWKMANKSKVPIIARDENSVKGFQKVSGIMSFLKSLRHKYTHIMAVNGCMPFLKVDTIMEAGRYFKDNEAKSMIAAVKRQNWYWNKDGKMINKKDPKEMATQLSPPVYETIHTFHTAPIKRILNQDKYWLMEKNDPALFEIKNPSECIDVDTMEDLNIVKSLMKGGFK